MTCRRVREGERKAHAWCARVDEGSSVMEAQGRVELPVNGRAPPRPSAAPAAALQLQWQEERLSLHADVWSDDEAVLFSSVTREQVRLHRRDWADWPLALGFEDGLGVVDDGDAVRWAQGLMKVAAYRQAGSREVIVLGSDGVQKRLHDHMCEHEETEVDLNVRPGVRLQVTCFMFAVERHA